MPKLDKIEEDLSEQDLILKWLLEEKISYIDLSKQYTISEENNKSKSVNTPFLGVKVNALLTANIINGNYISTED